MENINKNIIKHIIKDIKLRMPIHLHKYNIHYTMQCLIIENEIIIEVGYTTSTAIVHCAKINRNNIDIVNDIIGEISKEKVHFYYENNKLKYNADNAIYVCSEDNLIIDMNF